MIRWSIGEENIKLINIYVPHTGAPKYLKEILTDIKGEIDGNTIIVGDFYTTLTSMNRSSRQKINKARDLKWHNGKVRYNCYFQYITSKKMWIDILFKCTWHILKDWPHTGAQS